MKICKHWAQFKKTTTLNSPIPPLLLSYGFEFLKIICEFFRLFKLHITSGCPKGVEIYASCHALEFDHWTVCAAYVDSSQKTNVLTLQAIAVH